MAERTDNIIEFKPRDTFSKDEDLFRIPGEDKVASEHVSVESFAQRMARRVFRKLGTGEISEHSRLHRSVIEGNRAKRQEAQSGELAEVIPFRKGTES